MKENTYKVLWEAGKISIVDYDIESEIISYVLAGIPQHTPIELFALRELIKELSGSSQEEFVRAMEEYKKPTIVLRPMVHLPRSYEIQAILSLKLSRIFMEPGIIASALKVRDDIPLYFQKFILDDSIISIEWLTALAYNPNTSSQIIDRLLEFDYSELTNNLVFHQNLSLSARLLLLSHASTYVRLEALRPWEGRLPRSLAYQLSQDSSSKIRLVLAEKDIGYKAMNRLSVDENPSVREALARRKDLTITAKKNLFYFSRFKGIEI